MKRIVIIGGGFAGINFVNRIANKEGFEVTLVDKNNYNFFPPLLYQIATGFLESANISFPFRKLIRNKKNIHFRLGELQKILPEENKVILSTGELSYDYLIFATGVTTNYFGMENVKREALPMKNVQNALELKNHILEKLEQAVFETDDRRRQSLLNIVVVGSGPTGVEVSGMLADMRKTILPRDFPEIVKSGFQANIFLIDALDAVLKPMSERSHQDSHKALTEMGVEIKLNMQVKDYVDGVVIFANGETIETKTLIWAAGVTGMVFDGIPSPCYGRGRRLQVDAYNTIGGFHNIYAVGDTCLQTHDTRFPGGHPQLAQVAIQQANNLADNLVAMLQGKALKPFSYWDKGSMAIIGLHRAVVDLPGNKVHFKGFIAWFMWLFVHLLSLVRRRNRLTTLYNWTTAYLTRDQAFRMIIRPSRD
jgi:NADH:ubiquinone reductase (H+-translocating)